MEISDDFGYWLAGFADGEGCFGILRNPGRASFHCQFDLALRADDTAILEECRSRTGVGVVRHVAARTDSERKTMPQTIWQVWGKRSCLVLVHIFDHHPLRAKKQRDFQIWREAVIEWHRVGPGRGRRGADWSRLAELYQQIRDVRVYDAKPGELPPRPAPATLFDPAARAGSDSTS